MHGTSIVATCSQLSSTEVTLRRDKLNHRRSTKMTIPAMIDGWFIALIVHLCLRHDSVAPVNLRQLIAILQYSKLGY